MVIDATGHTADVIITRLRALARRTHETRIVTVCGNSERIAACVVAWAQVMGHSTAATCDGSEGCFKVWLEPQSSSVLAA